MDTQKKEEKTWESICKEHIESNAIDLTYNPYEHCPVCKDNYRDSAEFGKEFEPCEDCDQSSNMSTLHTVQSR